MRTLVLPLVLTSSAAAADVPRVVADIAPVHSIVAAVMEGVGEPDLIIPPGASPHGYAMRPSEARALSQADVVVWVGHGLTPWFEEPLESLAPKAEHFELMEIEGLRLLSYREGAAFEHDHDHGDEGHKEEEHAHEDEHAHGDHDEHDHDKEEHAHDDHDDHGHEKEEHAHDDHDEEHAEKADAHGHDEHAHGDIDPHVWLDPMNGAAAAVAIAELLSERDPENAATYTANAKAFGDDVNALQGDIAKTLAPVAGRPFVVFHDAYHYFEARFDFEAVAAVSAGDAVDPGAARISEVREHIAEVGAVCAFAEPQMNVSVLQTVIEGEGAKVATLDPLGSTLDLGPALYPQLLRDLGQSLAGCLTPSG